MSGNARRLENDYRELREAFDGDPRVKIKALGTAPFDKYRIAYVGVPSLRQNQSGQPMLVEQTVVDIELPAGYPKLPALARTRISSRRRCNQDRQHVAVFRLQHPISPQCSCS